MFLVKRVHSWNVKNKNSRFEVFIFTRAVQQHVSLCSEILTAVGQERQEVRSKSTKEQR